MVAQDPLSGVMKMGFGDVAGMKQKAEAGDPQAQLSLGDVLSFNHKTTEALQWYQKAAEQGLVEAESRLGELLLFGGFGIPSNQTVKANPFDGIRWTFKAATNHNAKAFLNMSKALQNGIGSSTNLVEAYAWLQLYSEQDTILGRVLLNQLALKLDVQSLQAAQALAAQFKAGQWPLLQPVDSRLKLNSVIADKPPLAIINGKTLGEGESAIISSNGDKLKITCLQIKQDSALVSIEGENETEWLRLR